MQRLVDTLLDVAKFATGEMPLVLTSVHLGSILEKNARRQSLLASKRDVTLDVVIAGDLPPVDVEKLDRVLPIFRTSEEQFLN
jgi:signal transduction histidine kinase